MSIIKVKTGGITADAITDALIADDVVGTEHLTANEVDTTALGADAVTAAQIADDAISEEHLDVTAITGHTAETSIADGDTLLIHDASASALRKMTKANFVSGIGGTNTPSFLAYLSSGQTVANTTTTTLVFQTEVYDSDSAYNTSNGTFTVPSGQGGKYYFTYGIRSSNWNTSELSGQLLDGSGNNYLIMEDGDAQGDNNTVTTSGIISLSAGDTIVCQWYQAGGGGTSPKTGQKNTWFGGFKLIGV